MYIVELKYEKVSPAVLASNLERAFNCMCFWHEIDEDTFEFSVFNCAYSDVLGDIFAEYM